MERSIQLMFAVQSPVGLRFGATLALDAARITFEMNVELNKGTVCPFRMELLGVETTVMGTIRIDRVLPKRADALSRFVGRIMDMPESDREAFDGWRRDQATGGISRRMERDPDAVRQHIVDHMRGATEAESRMVLDRMNQKSVYKRKTTDLVEGDPFGLADEDVSRSDVGEHEGAEMRASLRARGASAAASMDASADAAPEESERWQPEPTDDSSQVNWALHVEAQPSVEASPQMGWLSGAPPASTHEKTPAAASVLASEPASDPEVQATAVVPSPIVAVQLNLTPIEITITFVSQASLVETYARGLKVSSLIVNEPGLEQLYLPVQVQLKFHDGRQLVCMGQTVLQTGQGMAIALELDSGQRASLAAMVDG
jgi:hypothetical protein